MTYGDALRAGKSVMTLYIVNRRSTGSGFHVKLRPRGVMKWPAGGHDY